MTETPSVLFLFKGGRKGRLQAGEPFPTEFLYGYAELAAKRRDVTLIEDSEWLPFPFGTNGLKLANRIMGRLLPGLPAAMPFTLQLARPGNLKRLNQAKTLVATTQTYGYCLGLLKRLGLLKPTILFIVMGALHENQPPRSRRFTRWVLQASKLLAISEQERDALARDLPGHADLHYLPFGVDCRFWGPGDESPPETPFVLSIGNDRHRDYETLVKAWTPDLPLLRIVTRLPVRTDQANIEIVSGDWRSQTLSDADIRRLFRQALFVVLPIRQTWQPSGQSACLQAMACDKAVVLSQIDGLWDRRALLDGETCSLVPPGDPSALQSAAAHLAENPSKADQLGRAAGRAIRAHLTADVMAQHLESHF